MKKKLLLLSMAAAMCLSIAGCGSKVSTASDVVKKYNELMDESRSYHVNMDMGMGIYGHADDMQVTIPIQLDLSADVFDTDISGSRDIYVSFDGITINEHADMYLDSDKHSSVLYTNNAGYWTKTEDITNVIVASGISDLNVRSFESASMEYDKETGVYTIIQPFDDFMDSDMVYKAMDDMYHEVGDTIGISIDDAISGWKTMDAVYKFDNEFYLTSISVEDCNYTTVIEQDDTELNASITLDLFFTFSDYGTIKADSVIPPASVVASAVDFVIPIHGQTGEGDSDTSYKEPDDGYYEMEPKNPEPSPDNDDGVDDRLGVYNDYELTGIGDPWNIFATDGWEFDESGDVYVSAVNDKYPGVLLNVYNSVPSGSNASDIMEHGFFGYSIDCYHAMSYPGMTWNGVSFCSQTNQIIDAYGQPEEVFDGELYSTYKYSIGKNVKITFYVYKSKGLQQVDVNYLE